MIFRQLFEPESSTFTYLVACSETRDAVLVDPVVETCERDLAVLAELGLKLAYTLDTHIHADHITAACRMRALSGCKVAYPAADALACADVHVSEERPLAVGKMLLQPVFTPGHTDTHHAYLVDEGGTPAIFTGDALLIDGCGRTDFQNGDADALYRSVRERIFTLPPETLVYPAHDYNGRRVSSVAQEAARNPRLGQDVTLEQFRAIMAGLDLPYPRKIDVAVPANRECGGCPDELVAELHAQGGKSPQG